MATLPRAVIDAYTESLNMLSSAARDTVAAMLEQVEYSDIADLREQVIEIMEAVCGASSDLASARAAEFYDEARAVQAGEAIGAVAASGREPSATAGAVRALVQRVVDGKPWESFVSGLQDRADYEVKRAANRCVIENADRDPAGPRWARVPTGSETCGFCIMLASRGYDYMREESADHAHPNCDCRVVPQFGGGSIEGYDPSYYEGLYRRNVVSDRAGTVNVNATAYAIEKEVRANSWRADETAMADRFQEMISEAEARFVAEKTKESYESTVGKVIEDIGREYGIELSTEFLSGRGTASAMPSGDEIWAVLAARSVLESVVFVGQDEAYGGNPDLMSGGVYIDVKTPRTLKKVGRRLNHAAGQCHARGQAEGVAILSSLRYEDSDFGKAIDVAREFVESGTLRRVIAIAPGGGVEVIE